MNENIIKNISIKENITTNQVKVVLKLLEENNTIPFIARYRKELTNGLDEEQIKSIEEVYTYQKNLLEKKEDTIRLIDEKGLLTEELKEKILNCEKLVEVDDLYRPFKEKKKTKATEAIKEGLEPLAKIIMSFPENTTLENITKKYMNEKNKTIEEVLQKASYIIAEWISDNAYYRKYIRNYIYKNATLETKIKKEENDQNKIYENYYNYQEILKTIKPHRIMAINRAEKEEVIKVNLKYNKEEIEKTLSEKIIKNKNSVVKKVVENSIKDSLKRLILPSIEREIRSEMKLYAEDESIITFKSNLENLLLTPPIKEKIVLGFDPAFRTGCKLAVLDKTGKVLDIKVIYPTEPHLKIEESKEILKELIKKYGINIIAIGNGTASRESEKFVSDTLKEIKEDVEYIIVNEAGASVYSASKLAIEEFPDLTVEKRSAISIGRRVQDSLSELVKIDPKSIGVGMYQHDVTTKKLDDSLNFIVEKCVNSVGVNINTASKSLLKYVSGLNKKTIDILINNRESNGKYKSREEIKKLKGITPKVYEQSIGFIRILEGENPLDKTSIHPESYEKTNELLKTINLTINDIGKEKLKNELNNLNKEAISKKINIDKYTLEDIIKSLTSPIRDPREKLEKPILRKDILQIEDLKIGDKLQGSIRNVVDFGLFIDIGLHNDGLAHISKLSNKFIKNPNDYFQVGQIIDCYVEEIDIKKEKVSLTLLSK